ncbi:MAG TPA: universal stress protein [Candidatus Dormibacteraeota bacterium]|jgi:nucleotide-binding universal stress UspA family protein|nr:universal stress protein [Candidatus Dormibacteraeota bacterium]
MYRHVLVASDPEGLAMATEPVVEALAGSGEPVVRVVGVERADDSSTVPGLTEERARELADRLRAHGVNATHEVRRVTREKTAEELAAVAREMEADLIVVGSHRHGDLAGILVGSVGHELATKIDVPMMVVGGPSRQQPLSLRRVLVALDASEHTTPVLTAAAQLAGADGDVLLAHVMPAPITSPLGAVSGEVESEDEAWQVLRHAQAELAGMGRASETRLLLSPEPVGDQIVALAKEWRADVIAVGSRRLGDLAALFLGSAAHRIIRLSRVPVLMADHPAE